MPSARPPVPFFIEQLQNGIQEFRIALVGHFGFELDVFRDTPTGNQLGPLDQFFARGAPPPLRGSAALGSLRSPSLRLTRRGGGEGKKDKLQKDFYTPS